MKSLEINSLGLEEMNSGETVSANGGCALAIACIAFLLGAALCLIAGRGRVKLI